MPVPVTEPSVDISPFRNPRPLLLAGMIGAVACILPVPLPVAIPLLVLSALAVGGAVLIRPNSIVLGLAALAALLLNGGFNRIGWDSIALMVGVLAAVAAAAAVILLLPPVGRRIVVSLLILIHFGGILTAVTTAPPANWTTMQLWTYFYRPYLQFMYLNNAYHFYSPEPGPAPVMWFFVEYQRDADGRNWRWVKVPTFNEQGEPVRPDGSRLWPNLEYTRRLSLAESVNTPGQSPNPQMWPSLILRRKEAAERLGIPFHPFVPLELQYRPPGGMAELWISSYVRYVARTYQHPRKPELTVTGIKVYRAIHNLITPAQILDHIHPHDLTLYWPYYFGEYDRDGHRKHESSLVLEDDASGEDPFLFWLIPIIKAPEDNSVARQFGLKPGDVKNYVYKHANVPDHGDLP